MSDTKKARKTNEKMTTLSVNNLATLNVIDNNLAKSCARSMARVIYIDR